MLPRLILLLLSLVAVSPLRAEPVRVVASFSILADFARNVGGDRILLSTLVGPGSDVHVFTPAPSDVKRVAEAGIVVTNGLGLEGWLPRLLQSSASRARVVTASAGIAPLRLGEGADPHAWQSVPNAQIYVKAIRDALVAADPGNAGFFAERASRYLAELDALDREIREAVEGIPPERRKVISTHDAFGYFAARYGIAFIAPLGVSTEAEPSARDVATIISRVRSSGIPAVFLENASDGRLVGRIAAETGAKIGGTLYSDSLTAENGEAPTYIAMVRHNIKALSSALGRQDR